MTSSKIFFYFCISFIVGTFINSAIKIPQLFLWVFLFSGIILIIIGFPLSTRSCRQGHGFTIAGFCVLFLTLGILRYQISEFNISNNKLRFFNDKEEVILTGIVFNEPDVREKYQKLTIKTEQLTINNFTPTPNFGVGASQLTISGKILVNAPKYPEYRYLDEIKIEGQLKTPQEIESFNYKNYLLKDGIYSVMDFPKIELVNSESYRGLTPVIYSGILFIKGKLRESIRKNYSPPETFILEGTILGDNGAMPQALKNKLNISGLRHIIAVSGTHIVILSGILMSLLLTLGLRRSQAFYFSVGLIWFYIILTGLPASGVRAGLMGSILLTSQKLGRQNTSSRTIIMACGLMLFLNPLLLFYDVGFQLSFLASMGIIYLEPIIKNFLEIFSKKKFKNFISILSTTFSAQIFTMPLMVFNFGNISFVSPLTNLLVLPIVPWLMIFGFISVFLGAVFNFLGQILFFPCWLLLKYFTIVIDFFSKPWAAKTIENVSWPWLVVSYLVLGFLVRFLRKLQKFKFLS